MPETPPPTVSSASSQDATAASLNPTTPERQATNPELERTPAQYKVSSLLFNHKRGAFRDVAKEEMRESFAQIPASDFLERFLPGDLGSLPPESIQTASSTLSSELKLKRENMMYAPLVSVIPFCGGLMTNPLSRIT